MNRRHWTDTQIIRAYALIQLAIHRGTASDTERSVILPQLLAEIRRRQKRRKGK